MRPYRLLTPASKDLVGILAYLDRMSPDAASHFLQSLDQRLRWLADGSLSGRARPELGKEDLRYISFDSYVIAFAPNTQPVQVAAILHGSRDLPVTLRDRT